MIEVCQTLQLFQCRVRLEPVCSIRYDDQVIDLISFTGIDSVEAYGIVLDLVPVEVERDAEDWADDGDSDFVNVGWFEVEGDISSLCAILEL